MKTRIVAVVALIALTIVAVLLFSTPNNRSEWVLDCQVDGTPESDCAQQWDTTYPVNFR